MTSSDDPAHDEVAKLRRVAGDIGMPSELRPEDHGLKLATADEFIARMKANDAGPVDITRDGPTSSAQSNWNWRRYARPIGAAAAVAAISSLILISPWSDPAATAATPPILDYELAKATNIAYAPGVDAKQDLDELSAAASNAKPPPRTGDIQYVQTDSWFATREDDGDSASTKVTPTVVQTWTSPDGSQTVAESKGAPLNAAGRGVKRNAADLSSAPIQTFPAGNADPEAISDLGDTPDEVRTDLLAAGECDPASDPTITAQCLYSVIAGLANQNVIPPAKASLIWAAISTESGFRSLGTVRDRAGRSGVGISVVSAETPQFRSVLIISPRTGQLLGVEEILIKSDPAAGLEAPAVNAFTAIVVADYRSTDRP